MAGVHRQVTDTVIRELCVIIDQWRLPSELLEFARFWGTRAGYMDLHHAEPVFWNLRVFCAWVVLAMDCSTDLKNASKYGGISFSTPFSPICPSLVNSETKQLNIHQDLTVEAYEQCMGRVFQSFQVP